MLQNRSVTVYVLQSYQVDIRMQTGVRMKLFRDDVELYCSFGNF